MYGEKPAELGSVVRILQIIVGAMAGGALVLVGVAAVLVGADRAQPNPQATVISYGAMAIAATALLARPLLLNSMTSSGRRRIALDGANADAAKRLVSEKTALAGLFQTRTIAACATIEGPVLLLAFGAFASRSPACVGAAAVLVVFLAMQMPSMLGAGRWVDDQLQMLDSERSTLTR